MRIRTKLFSSVAIAVLGFLAGFVILVVSRNTVSDLDRLEVEVTRVVAFWQSLNSSAKDMLLAQEPISDTLSRFDAAREQFQEALRDLLDNPDLEHLSDSTLRGLSNVSGAWELYSTNYDIIGRTAHRILESGLGEDIGTHGAHAYFLREIQRGESREELRLLQTLVANVGTVSQSVQDFTDKLFAVSEQIRHQASALSERSRVTSLFIFAAATVFALGFAVVFSTRMAQRIRALESTMSVVAQRDISVRAVGTSLDEIGSLGSDLNRVLDTIEEFVRATRDASEQVGALRSELSAGAQQTVASVGEIGTEIDALRSRLLSMNEDLERSAEATASITERLKGLRGLVGEQVDAVSLTSSSVEEINAAIQTIAALAKDRERRSDNLLRVTEEGGNKVASTNEAIADVVREVDSITEVIHIIEEFAESTALLSMNAAIESAHAGEFGLGFAVVAEEIRKLAESITESSQQITHSLKSIAGKISEARTSSVAGAGAFDEISRHVHEFASAMSEIASGIEELSVGSNEILQSMASLSEISQTVHGDYQSIEDDAARIRTYSREARDLSGTVVTGVTDIQSNATEILRAVSQVNSLSDESNAQIAELESIVESFRTNSDDDQKDLAAVSEDTTAGDESDERAS
jgi:methyl-accepting chemotaxis protein